jgi:hypothetical protein
MSEYSEAAQGSDSWVPDDALAALNMERQLNPSETEEQLARRLLREALPRSAASIIHMATHSYNERVRLDASKYVVERTMGRIGDNFEGDVNPWEKLFNDIMNAPANRPEPLGEQT